MSIGFVRPNKDLLTPLSSGRLRTAFADRTIEGNHSHGFQLPDSKFPQSCPIRTMTGFKGVSSREISNIRDATHFDSPYPIPIAVFGSGITIAGTGPPEA